MRKFATAFAHSMVVLVLAGSPLHADDKVDNPLYQHWAQFKIGSFSVTKTVQTVEVAGTEMKTETTATTKLTELNAEKAVIEISTVTEVAGTEQRMPPTTMDIAAKITKTELETQEKQKEPEGKPETKEGEEELEVAGKKLKTKWVEVTTKQGNNTIKTRSWMCEDVPGQVVKTVTTMEGETMMTSETTLVEFEAEKK